MIAKAANAAITATEFGFGLASDIPTPNFETYHGRRANCDQLPMGIAASKPRIRKSNPRSFPNADQIQG